MSETLEPARSAVVGAAGPVGAHGRAGLCLAGCASVSQDVDAYYRQMAYNYKEAEEKAKMDAVALENETKVLATTGDFGKSRRELSGSSTGSRRGRRSATRRRSDSRRPPSGRRRTSISKSRRLPWTETGVSGLRTNDARRRGVVVARPHREIATGSR